MTTVRLAVRVTPRAKRPGLAGRRADGVLLVRVGAPPEDGRANSEVCAVVARAIGVRPRDVTVVIGPTSRDKVLEVAGLDEPELAARLQAHG
ncbi:MAG: DUF167 domain-containing protein [Solirubrobacteraceae bacterium]|nr:DUF167 domain-containing protein [Solirubrobacteraceae bacterium]